MAIEADLHQSNLLTTSGRLYDSSLLYSGHDVQGEGEGKDESETLFQMLQAAATANTGITIQTVGRASGDVRHTSYKLLLDRAEAKARLLSQVEGLSNNCVVLLHFDKHEDNIEWFWAVIAAGFIPAISTPLAADVVQRQAHLLHLHKLLHDPVILTSERLVGQFLGLDQLRIHSVELFIKPDRASHLPFRQVHTRHDDLAVLMLTSGSTGNAKAVCLTYAQIWASVKGKSKAYRTTSHDIFFNWIGFDHVANLLEIHLHAMSLGAEQIHIQAEDLLADPLLFFRLIDVHRVSRTFAPNFFLDLLERKLAAKDSFTSNLNIDLSCLTSVLSGGEANVVQTAINLTRRLSVYRVTREIVAPGYGLTESCAAATYQLFCPSYELAEGHEFSSIGSAIPGARMRIMTDAGLVANAYEVGNLQMTGPVVFKSYYNDPESTRAVFTDDGWFITGDRAYIDSYGKYNIAGRTKEMIVINGVKHFPQDIENALAASHIPGIELSYVASFPYRPPGAQTEGFCVAYHPTFDLEDAKARSETADLILMVASTVTGTKPYRIIPLPKSQLWRSSLGKLSRAKIQKEFERGSYRDIEVENTRIIKSYRSQRRQNPRTSTEETVLKLLCDTLDLSPDEFGVDDDMFSLGITSITLIELLERVNKVFALERSLSVLDLLSNPVLRDVAQVIDNQGRQQYNPVVPLRKQGTKTPLWLMHPAAGNIFCFLPLARCFTDRPVYAMRARGLNPGEEPFDSIADTAETYYTHVKRVQPQGPYAIAGYSLGTTVGFEVAKLLEADGSEVALLAAIDSPPHPASIVRPLDWATGAVLVSYFLDLIAEESVRTTIPSVRESSREDIVAHLLRLARPSQREALNLDAAQLLRIANVTNTFGDAAKVYGPRGTVRKADVFYCTPLAMVCMSKEAWLRDHLTLWADFSRSAPSFHECGGHHVRMLDNAHVRSFYGKLQAVLDERGI